MPKEIPNKNSYCTTGCKVKNSGSDNKLINLKNDGVHLTLTTSATSLLKVSFFINKYF